jgi:glycyl-tRNA synthetase
MTKEFNRAALEDLMKRRFIIAPAFQIYAGVAGLYDYGPVGCAIKANLIALWRQHFVLNEDMLEVDCTALTPIQVLDASGHLERFHDYMVKDEKTQACHRADHLLEDAMKKLLEDPKVNKAGNEAAIAEYKLVKARAGDYTKEELSAALKKYNVKAPETDAPLSEPFTFNLMFETPIGPTGNLRGFLRPETAQGIFVNFKRLLEYNGGKLPFAAAQIGNAYRNEIAPRSGLLRVREFTMAEIEHFVKPTDKSHPKFQNVAGLTVNLLSAENQSKTGELIVTTFGEAVSKGLIANETLGYYLGRTLQFLHTAGVKPDRLRFRQHQNNEMAHYANDCWDAEIQTSYGWVECVGHADRGCYDLTKHTEKSKEKLFYYEEFKDGPRMIKSFKPTLNKGLMGKTFKKAQEGISILISQICANDESAKALKANLESAGSAELEVGTEKFVITKEMVQIAEVEEKVNGESITPHVIEPSFGLGRIIYSILEHSYNVREGDEQRGYLSLSPIIAPTKVSVLPLRSSPQMQPFVTRITALLKEHGISSKVDTTGTAIGRRYARTDEIGIPFGITIDPDTEKDDTVTVRERDSMKQVRVPINEVAPVLKQLCELTQTWEQVLAKYPVYENKPDEE